MKEKEEGFLGYLCSAGVDGDYGKVHVCIRRFKEKDGTLVDSDSIIEWNGQANVKSRRAKNDPLCEVESGTAFTCDNMYTGRDGDWKTLRDDVGKWYALKPDLPGKSWHIDGQIEELDRVRGLLVKISKAMKKFQAQYPEVRMGDELQFLTVGFRAAGIVPIRQHHENYTTTYTRLL
jgi:hypothetical protein